MKRIIFFLLALLVTAGFILFSCLYYDVQDLPLPELYGRVSGEALFTKDPADSLKFRQNLDLSPELFDEVLYVAPQGFMDVEELILIKSSDSAALDEAEKAIEKRLEARKNTFETYAPEEYGLLSNAKVYRRGPYLFFVVHPDAESVIRILSESVGRL